MALKIIKDNRYLGKRQIVYYKGGNKAKTLHLAVKYSGIIKAVLQGVDVLPPLLPCRFCDIWINLECSNRVYSVTDHPGIMTIA